MLLLIIQELLLLISQELPLLIIQELPLIIIHEPPLFIIQECLLLIIQEPPLLMQTIGLSPTPTPFCSHIILVLIQIQHLNSHEETADRNYQVICSVLTESSCPYIQPFQLTTGILSTSIDYDARIMTEDAQISCHFTHCSCSKKVLFIASDLDTFISG